MEQIEEAQSTTDSNKEGAALANNIGEVKNGIPGTMSGFTQSDIESLHSQLVTERERSHELKELREAAIKHVDELKAVIEKKDNENRVLVKVLATQHDKQLIISLREEKSALEQQVASLKLALESTASIDSGSSEVITPSQACDPDEHIKTIATLQQQLSQSEAHCKSLEESLNSSKQEWQVKEANLTSDLKAALETVDKLNKEKHSLNATGADELEALKSQLSQATETAKTEKEALEEKLRIATRKRVQAQAELTSTSSALEQCKEQLESTTSELNSVKERLRDSNEELLNTKSELDRLNQSWRKTSEELIEKQASLDTTKKELKTALKERNDAVIDCEQYKEMVRKHDEVIHSVNRSKDELIVQHKIMNKKSRQLIKDLKSQLAKEHAENQQLVNELEKTSKELGDSNARYEAQLKQVNDNMNSEVSRLSDELESLKSQQTNDTTLSTSASLSAISSHLSASASRLTKRVSSNIEQVIPLTGQTTTQGDNDSSLQDPVVKALCERLEGLLKVKEVLEEKVRHLETSVQSLTTELMLDRERLEATDSPSSPNRTLRVAPISVVQEDDPDFDEENQQVEL